MVEASPPKAPIAPPTAIKRAVPLSSLLEAINASYAVCVCAKALKIDSANVDINNKCFFIFSLVCVVVYKHLVLSAATSCGSATSARACRTTCVASAASVASVASTIKRTIASACLAFCYFVRARSVCAV